MPGLKISREQSLALADRLGVDDPRTLTYETLVARVEEMQGRAARSYADSDPTGILRLDVPVDEAPRAMSGRDDPADRVLDGAVGRGAIRSEDRAAWRTRYEKNPDVVGEILDGLPGDPALAERAFEQDERLRGLGDALDRYMGIEPVAREFDDGSLSDEERLYQRFAEMTNAPDAR